MTIVKYFGTNMVIVFTLLAITESFSGCKKNSEFISPVKAYAGNIVNQAPDGQGGFLVVVQKDNSVYINCINKNSELLLNDNITFMDSLGPFGPSAHSFPGALNNLISVNVCSGGFVVCSGVKVANNSKLYFKFLKYTRSGNSFVNQLVYDSIAVQTLNGDPDTLYGAHVFEERENVFTVFSGVTFSGTGMKVNVAQYAFANPHFVNFDNSFDMTVPQYSQLGPLIVKRLNSGTYILAIAGSLSGQSATDIRMVSNSTGICSQLVHLNGRSLMDFCIDPDDHIWLVEIAAGSGTYRTDAFVFTALSGSSLSIPDTIAVMPNESFAYASAIFNHNNQVVVAGSGHLSTVPEFMMAAFSLTDKKLLFRNSLISGANVPITTFGSIGELPEGGYQLLLQQQALILKPFYNVIRTNEYGEGL